MKNNNKNIVNGQKGVSAHTHHPVCIFGIAPYLRRICFACSFVNFQYAKCPESIELNIHRFAKQSELWNRAIASVYVYRVRL